MSGGVRCQEMSGGVRRCQEMSGGVGQRCMIFKIRYTSLTGHFRACVVLIAFDPTGPEDLLLLQLDRSLPSYIGRTGAW